LEGLHAPTLLYSAPVISEMAVLTPGQCFVTVGGYLTEAIPMVIDDGGDSEAQEAA
jgi:hypothetical protein